MGFEPERMSDYYIDSDGIEHADAYGHDDDGKEVEAEGLYNPYDEDPGWSWSVAEDDDE